MRLYKTFEFTTLCLFYKIYFYFVIKKSTSQYKINTFERDFLKNADPREATRLLYYQSFGLIIVFYR